MRFGDLDVIRLNGGTGAIVDAQRQKLSEADALPPALNRVYGV